MRQGTGFGIIGDIIIGIIGAFIGAWLLPQLGVRIGAGIVNAIASATTWQTFMAVPEHQELARAMAAYDLIGLQTQHELSGEPARNQTDDQYDARPSPDAPEGTLRRSSS
jgi:hypothetical protein